MSGQRVAVTGVGIVSALGLNAPDTFRALSAGQRGLAAISLFDPGEVRSKLVGEVHGLDIAQVARAGEVLEFSRTDAMAVLAAREATRQAKLPAGQRLGVALGGTTGGMFETEGVLSSPELSTISQARAEQLLTYPLSASLSRVVQSVGGARVARSVCSACSGGAIALVQAMAWLKSGAVDFALAGGADGLCRLTVLGFNSLGATDPAPCRPFDRSRAGLNLGEGAALLVLEREESAVLRGAEVLAWLDGFAVGAEAHHITHPDPTGARASALMREAMQRAGLSASTLSYVNAHGTGTAQNDAMEARVLLDVLGEAAGRTFVSSSKAQLGHTLGAAGAIEAAITVLALHRGVVPPTVGLSDPELPGLRHVPDLSVSANLTSALSSSFGFGGMSCVLAFASAGTAAPVMPSKAVRVVATFAVSWGAFGLVETRVGEGGRAEAFSVPEPPEPEAELAPERSRRFDRGSAFAAACAERALRGTAVAGDATGLILGTAFGNVERTMAFLARANERGPRYASPAEFPHLVPSAAVGNAAIYAGLRGPVFAVSDLAQSGEAALSAACDLLGLGAVTSVLAGAIAPHDAIVERILGPLLDPSSRVDGSDEAVRGEGAGLLLLEEQGAAKARGARALAEVLGRYAGSLQGEGPLPGLPPPTAGLRHQVVLGATPMEAREQLARSAWGGAPVLDVSTMAGHHEALGAIASATAICLLAAGEAAVSPPDRVLVLSGGPLGYWALLLGRSRDDDPSSMKWQANG